MPRKTEQAIARNVVAARNRKAEIREKKVAKERAAAERKAKKAARERERRANSKMFSSLFTPAKQSSEERMQERALTLLETHRKERKEQRDQMMELARENVASTHKAASAAENAAAAAKEGFTLLNNLTRFDTEDRELEIKIMDTFTPGKPKAKPTAKPKPRRLDEEYDEDITTEDGVEESDDEEEEQVKNTNDEDEEQVEESDDEEEGELVDETDEEEEDEEYEALMALTAAKAKVLKQRLTVAVIGRMERHNLIRIFKKCDEFGLVDHQDRAALTNAQLAAFLKHFGAFRTGMAKFQLVSAVRNKLG